ncbi:hypothetical protein F5141DRAFT_1195407 [Pisolithus sp. B1]|nr:hypothetical protein F5141DRAFT_1195407 [Pisolithus sp. B1]
MTSDSDSVRMRRDNEPNLLHGAPVSAPPAAPSRFPDRPVPTRASTLGSAHDLGRSNLSAKHDFPTHARSDDLNHFHSSWSDLNGMPGSLLHPSPGFLSASRPTTPNSSNQRPRRRSVASQFAPNKAGGPLTSTSSTTSANLSSSPCSACGNSMQGAFVRALGTVFHLNCFKCLDCGDVVASKFFPIDGPEGKQQPLCEKDYFRRLNLICANCGSALRGSYITACNKKYHVEHFTCSLCSTVFGPQDSYYEHDGDVYCHFHYSTRFATKCAGCSSAILKQFVEINRNMRDECWHPECYMINKFWNVKVVSRRSSASISDGSELEPSYAAEEERETSTSLKDKQSRMEQLVYRIWTVLSAFEESSAACISDMLRQVSNGQYLDAIRMAEKFILHVEVLFGAIDDLEYHSARLNLKGISHVREARMLCRKTVDLFTLLSRTQETGSRRTGMTQDLLALVTGIAHYLKILIRIALTGALKLEREQSVREAMPSFLDKLHLLAVQAGDPGARRLIKNGSGEVVGAGQNGSVGNLGTQGVTYGYRSLAPELAGESPFSITSTSRLSVNNPPSDRCIKCAQAVEEDCVRLGTYQRWHSHCLQCNACGKAAAVAVSKEPSVPKDDKEKDKSEKDPAKSSAIKRPPANVGIFAYEVESLKDIPPYGEVPSVILCTDHAHSGCRNGFQPVSRLEQYAFLLNIALRRLYLVLKQQGVIPLSPVASAAPTPKSGEQDPYRNSGDIMRMKSVHLDRKLSATARLPRRSTVVNSPTGKTVHPSEPSSTQRPQPPQEAVIKAPQPQRGPPPNLIPGRQPSQPGSSSGTNSLPPSRNQLRSPATLDTNVLNLPQARPPLVRNNTEVKIVDDSAPNSPAVVLEESPLRVPDDGITLADIPQLVEAAQAREQQRSLPRQSTAPHISGLSALELAIVKHCALLALLRSPIRDQVDLDEILELIEAKKGGFWNKLFKAGDKKNVKKKGVFGIPLELLVEREGCDSLHGATRTTLRVPSFIDDVVSAMRQMDMSVEGIFRRNGNIRRLKDLSETIDHDPSSVDLTQDNPVQLAALLKKFLRELPEPLMTFKLHRLLIASLTDAERRRILHMVSLLLPKSHRDTMEVLFVFLKWVASFAHMDESTGSKMDLQNLATVICPSILYSRGRDAVRDESFGAIRVVTSLLENQDEFYTVPDEFIPILRDQDYFANGMDLPSKEFMKKCDTYMRLKANNNNGRPALAAGMSSSSPNISTSRSPPELMTTIPNDSQIRNGRQHHPQMSYPSPVHTPPTSLSQGAMMLQNQSQQQQQQPQHPRGQPSSQTQDQDWAILPRPNATSPSGSSPGGRPASYAPPLIRTSGEHVHAVSPNGYQAAIIRQRP